jgi:U3 small nucleolar RNA-associated protein 10
MDLQVRYELVPRCVLTSLRTDSSVHNAAAKLLNNTLRFLTAFWGGQELSNVVRLCIEAGNDPTEGKLHSSIISVARTVAKKVPAKALLPTLADAWPSVEQSPAKVCHLPRFWNVLKLLPFF